MASMTISVLELKSPPAWLAKIGILKESFGPKPTELTVDWIGTGFAVNWRCIVTCKHVIADAFMGRDAAVVVAFENGLRYVVEAGNIYRHPDQDIALLEIDGDAPDLATLALNQRGERLERPDSQFTAFGYPANFGGERLKCQSLRGADLDHQRVVDAHDGRLDFIKNSVALMEGFSGGPLVCEEHGQRPVLAINTLGGQRALVGGYYPVDIVARFAFEVSRRTGKMLYPKHVMEAQHLFGGVDFSAVMVKERQKAWSTLLGFDGPRVTLTFTMNGTQYRERFILLPPNRDGVAPYYHESQPVWLQESVVSAHMAKQSEDHSAAGRALSFRDVCRVFKALGELVGLPLRLPTVDEWRRAITGESSVTPPLVQSRLPDRGYGVVKRIDDSDGLENPLGFHPTPRGLFELLNPAHESTEPQPLLVYSSRFDLRGEPDCFALPANKRDLAVAFRMAIPVHADLSVLKPEWEISV